MRNDNFVHSLFLLDIYDLLQTMARINAQEPALYEALVGKYTEKQREQFSRVVTLAEQRLRYRGSLKAPF